MQFSFRISTTTSSEVEWYRVILLLNNETTRLVGKSSTCPSRSENELSRETAAVLAITQEIIFAITARGRHLTTCPQVYETTR